MIRVTITPQPPLYLNTKIKINSRYWSGKEKHWIKDIHPSAFEINALINKKVELIEKWCYRQTLFNKPVTLDAIKALYKKKRSK